MWLLAGLLLLVVVAYWPSLQALGEIWGHPERRTYQHGHLVAAISVWLVYRDRTQISRAVAGPQPLVLGLLALTSIVWAIAWNAGIQVGHVLLWPVALWLAACGAMGWQVGRRLLFPVGYLYFAMPLWELLMPGLQLGTVLANQVLASATGIPALIEGHLIHIPAGSFLIAGGCSGLNYLLVGLAIGSLQGEVNRDDLRRRVLLVVLAGGLAILSNWLRVFIIIVAGHLTDMRHYLVQVDHYNFGWVLYGVVLVGYFYLVRRLTDAPAAQTAAGPIESRQIPVWAAVAAAAALLLGPALSTRNDQVLPLAAGSDPRVSGWDLEPAVGPWRPHYAGADREWLQDYVRGTDRISAYVASYSHQGQSHEMVTQGNSVIGDVHSRLADMTQLPVTHARPSAMAEAVSVTRSGQPSAVVRWTYQIGQRQFASGFKAQLWYGMSSLLAAPVSSVVVLRAACLPDCHAARALLDEWTSEALPAVLESAGNSSVEQGS